MSDLDTFMRINSRHWIKLAGFCGDEYFESEGKAFYIFRFSYEFGPFFYIF